MWRWIAPSHEPISVPVNALLDYQIFVSLPVERDDHVL